MVTPAYRKLSQSGFFRSLQGKEFIAKSPVSEADPSNRWKTGTSDRAVQLWSASITAITAANRQSFAVIR